MESSSPEDKPDAAGVVLLTGATGYVGGRLLLVLEARDTPLRCLARNPDKLRLQVPLNTEITQGDVLNRASLDRAMEGVHTAFYLVHLMPGEKDFEEEDREAAQNFADAAKKAGVQRIIYLGGLGEDGPDLSPHLRSRHEVGEILETRASSALNSGPRS